MAEYTFEELADMHLTYDGKKRMDAKHEDCTTSGLQLVIFQVILYSPVWIDDCEIPVRLPCQTEMLDVLKIYERQKWNARNYERQSLNENFRSFFHKYASGRIRNEYNQKVAWRIVREERMHIYDVQKMLIPTGQTLCSGYLV